MTTLLVIALIVAIFCDVIRIVQYVKMQKTLKDAAVKEMANRVGVLMLEFYHMKGWTPDSDFITEFHDYVEAKWMEEVMNTDSRSDPYK